jgi:antirestriction protein ArdC
MPPDFTFRSPESHAAVQIHELSHRSGAPHRLARKLDTRFGSTEYSREELRVEIASAMICSTLGLPTDIENHASYIGSWIETLKSDKREIFKAAADAQKIADYLLGFHPDHAASSIRATPGYPETVDSAGDDESLDRAA